MTRCIAFDMDGTLFDCAPVIEESYARGAARFADESGLSLTLPTEAMIRSVLGMTADHFFKGLFPDTDPVHYPAIDRLFTEELLRDVRRKRGILYDGAADLLSRLYAEGWKIVIASNGQFDYLTAVIETYGLGAFLAHSPVVVNYRDIRDKSAIVATYRDIFSLEPGQDLLVMAGDRSSDIKAGKDNGAFTIGCSFGHAGDAELEGADCIIHDISEVYHHLPLLPV